ncbi:DUF4876 domain-containing protein [Saccharicrinis sp. FJH62]|uniref:DUF4876 domain-containing protein n=1 Tax=Saccharicrinis sp. FJH62 TaxID=3344657 RepID=UPI0035D43465
MQKIFYIGLILFLLSGCVEQFERDTVSLSLQVTFNETFGSENAVDIPVRIQHMQKDVSLTGHTDSEGMIHFSNLDPGFYTISTNVIISAQKAEELSNKHFEDSLVFNANTYVSLLKSATDTLIIVPAFKSDLIIREYYYSGSRTETGKLYYADQYIELYNNSAKSVDIGGIIIAMHESLGNGYNMWYYIKDSVMVDMLWQIPDHDVLQPGEGAVIARDAIDHKSDPNGNKYSPVDLSKADFEFYMISDDNSDIDSPAENLKEIYTMDRGNDITFNTRFGGGLMIIRPESVDINTYILNHREKKYNVTGSSFKYAITIPNSWVIDAIDVFQNANSTAYKRFPESIDAGFTYNDDAGTGTCISRKLVSDVDGRKIYMDTNNSTYDFLNHQIPNPNINE